MRKASEKTIIKVLVNLKCLGKMGKCSKSLGYDGRGYVLDELIRRGYIDRHLNVLPAAKDVVIANIHLCE